MIDDLIERIIDENDLTSDQKLAMLKIIVSRKKETRKEHIYLLFVVNLFL